MAILLFIYFENTSLIHHKIQTKNAPQDFCGRFSVFVHSFIDVWLYFVLDVISYAFYLFFPYEHS